jgi:hypothetical protein
MRAGPALGGLVFVIALSVSPVALAAPTCLDRRAETVRCEARGAMPVGWAPAPDEIRAHAATTDSELGFRRTLGLICLIGGLFALFALLPDFDGGWDRQEDDREPRG